MKYFGEQRAVVEQIWQPKLLAPYAVYIAYVFEYMFKFTWIDFSPIVVVAVVIVAAVLFFVCVDFAGCRFKWLWIKREYLSFNSLARIP